MYVCLFGGGWVTGEVTLLFFFCFVFLLVFFFSFLFLFIELLFIFLIAFSFSVSAYVGRCVLCTCKIVLFIYLIKNTLAKLMN